MRCRKSKFLFLDKEILYDIVMSRSLKYLNALRSFEASARLGTFTRAAEELGVTPAAVGQQVRILEDYLGRKVFRRTAEGLKPTATASLALTELYRGFDRLEAGFQQLVGSSADNQLSISVAPTIASKWLAPRMQGLYERCPQIDLRMDTSIGFVDIAAGEFDIAIRYGGENHAELKSDLLFDEYILPVCAPGLCKFSENRPREEQLLSFPLLHIEGETSDPGALNWRDWGARFSLKGDHLDSGPRYPQTAMAVQAAVNGQGIALCGLTSVIDDLVVGRLITPLHPSGALKTHFAYRIIHAPRRHQSAILMTFTRWIKAEASKTRELMATFLSVT